MGPAEGLTRRTSLRVRYADTDQMRIVYNGKYFEYFEVGRTELLRSVGLPYARLEEEGFRLPLVEAHCEFLSPARYDDVLVIESTVRDYARARLRIDYIVTREHDLRTIARGYTVHAFQRIEDGRVTRPPHMFLDALRNAPPDPRNLERRGDTPAGDLHATTSGETSIDRSAARRCTTTMGGIRESDRVIDVQVLH